MSAHKPWVKASLLAALATASVLNATKGMTGHVEIFGWPFYELTYEHGFIRRGLVGTVFQALTSGHSPEDQRGHIVALHPLLVFGLLAFLAWWAWSVAARREPGAREAVLAGTAAFLLSQLPPTLSLNCGYLDPYILGTTALGAYAASRKHYAVAALIGSVGALIHDASAFLWMSVIAASVLEALREPLERRRWRARSLLAMPLATSGLVMALHSPTAAKHAVEALHASSEIKSTILNYHFGYTLSVLIPTTTKLIVDNPSKVLLGAAFFWLPASFSLVSAVKAARLRGWREISCAIVAAFSPCAVLFVATDSPGSSSGLASVRSSSCSPRPRSRVRRSPTTHCARDMSIERR